MIGDGDSSRCEISERGKLPEGRGVRGPNLGEERND